MSYLSPLCAQLRLDANSIVTILAFITRDRVPFPLPSSNFVALRRYKQGKQEERLGVVNFCLIPNTSFYLIAACVQQEMAVFDLLLYSYLPRLLFAVEPCMVWHSSHIARQRAEQVNDGRRGSIN